MRRFYRIRSLPAHAVIQASEKTSVESKLRISRSSARSNSKRYYCSISSSMIQSHFPLWNNRSIKLTPSHFKVHFADEGNGMSMHEWPLGGIQKIAFEWSTLNYFGIKKAYSRQRTATNINRSNQCEYRIFIGKQSLKRSRLTAHKNTQFGRWKQKKPTLAQWWNYERSSTYKESLKEPGNVKAHFESRSIDRIAKVVSLRVSPKFTSPKTVCFHISHFKPNNNTMFHIFHARKIRNRFQIKLCQVSWTNLSKFLCKIFPETSFPFRDLMNQ